MFGILDDVTSIAANTASIVAAPIKIATSAASAVTKPIAEVATEMAKEVQEALS
jgi:hypothetical protein